MNNEPLSEKPSKPQNRWHQTSHNLLPRLPSYFFQWELYKSRAPCIAQNVCVVLFSLQLEVGTLIVTPHIRSLANQIIQFNTTNNVGENSTAVVMTHMHFCSAYDCSPGYPPSTLTHRLTILMITSFIRYFLHFMISFICWATAGVRLWIRCPG